MLQTPLKEKGQVSIEILLIAGIVILLSVTVFGYYLSVRDSTTGMQVLKVAVLKQIDVEPKLYTMEKIEYKIDQTAGTVTFCVFTKPDAPAALPLNTAAVETLIEDSTAWEPGQVIVSHNPVGVSPCA